MGTGCSVVATSRRPCLRLGLSGGASEPYWWMSFPLAGHPPHPHHLRRPQPSPPPHPLPHRHHRPLRPQSSAAQIPAANQYASEHGHSSLHSAVQTAMLVMNMTVHSPAFCSSHPSRLPLSALDHLVCSKLAHAEQAACHLVISVELAIASLLGHRSTTRGQAQGASSHWHAKGSKRKAGLGGCMPS